jgi:oligopeptide transport system substrate-binding protein
VFAQPEKLMVRLFLPLLLGTAGALAACGGGGQRQADAPVVVSAIGSRLTVADPSAGALDGAQRVLMSAVAQGLVRVDGAGQIEPGLAERWIVIDDGRSYIFRLREAAWPDGSRVTASQVVRALRRAAAPNSRNPLAPFLAVIDEVVEMTPQVIEVRLKRPRPDLLKLFAQPELAVFRASSRDGSGPFRAQPRGDGLLLQPVLDPSHSQRMARDETVWLTAERAALALARFKANGSDLVTGGTFADWPIVAQAGIAPANLHIDPAAGLFGLAVTSREGFLTDAQNRAAIAMAVDRARLTQALLPDWAPADTLLPSQLDSAAPPVAPTWAGVALPERRNAARARVAAWRRANGGEAVTLRLALPSGPGATLLWAHLAEALLAIGAKPERVAMDDDRAELRLLDLVSPYDSGRWFIATACIACSDAARTAIEAAREAPDLAARARRIAEADAALAADTAFIPLAQPLRWSVVALRLTGWQRNTRAWHPLNHLRNEVE